MDCCDFCCNDDGHYCCTVGVVCVELNVHTNHVHSLYIDGCNVDRCEMIVHKYKHEVDGLTCISDTVAPRCVAMFHTTYGCSNDVHDSACTCWARIATMATISRTSAVWQDAIGSAGRIRVGARRCRAHRCYLKRSCAATFFAENGDGELPLKVATATMDQQWSTRSTLEITMIVECVLCPRLLPRFRAISETLLLEHGCTMWNK